MGISGNKLNIIDFNNNFNFRRGLIRATNNQSNRNSITSMDSINNRIDVSYRPISINSIENETVEEEKLQHDNSVTEKHLNGMMMIPEYSHLCKSPSASNSITVSLFCIENVDSLI